jgi:hypothetical protein
LRTLHHLVSNLSIVASRGVDGIPETDAGTLTAADVGELCADEAEELDDESVDSDVWFSSYSSCAADGDGAAAAAPVCNCVTVSLSSSSLSMNSGLVTERECLPIVGKYIGNNLW